MLSTNRGFKHGDVRRSHAAAGSDLCVHQRIKGKCPKWDAEWKVREAVRGETQRAAAAMAGRRRVFEDEAKLRLGSEGFNFEKYLSEMCDLGDRTALEIKRDLNAPPPPAFEVLVAPRLPKSRCRYLHLPPNTPKRDMKTKSVRDLLVEHDPLTKLLVAYLEQGSMTCTRKDLFPVDTDVDADAVDPAEMEQLREQRRLETLKVEIVQAGGTIFDLSHLPALLPLFAAGKCVSVAPSSRYPLTGVDVDFTNVAFVVRLLHAVVHVAASVQQLVLKDCSNACTAEEKASSEDGDDEAAEGGGVNEEEQELEAGKERAAATEEDGNQPPLLPSIRSLGFQYCSVVTIDALLAALKALGISKALGGLDVAHNRIDSLRFLYFVSASFPCLVRLALADNPITRKPDYREQVRATLSRLVLLDGVIIRKPPLALPYPTQWSDAEAHGKVMHAIADFFTAVERGEGFFDEAWALQHFHPSCTFSLRVLPGCKLFDEAVYGSGVDKTLEVQPLSALDRKELEVMSVAVENASRNLLLGRVAVHRIFRGPINVLEGYISTLYPRRFAVDHCLGFCEASVTVLRPPGAVPSPPPPRSTSRRGDYGANSTQKKKAKKHTQGPEPTHAQQSDNVSVFSVKKPPPTVFLATLHGTMTWRMPTMIGGDGVRVCYDRTLTVVAVPADEQIGPAAYVKAPLRKKTRVEKNDRGADNAEKKPDRFLICNDEIVLRSSQGEGSPPSHSAVFSPYTLQRIARLRDIFAIPTTPAGAAQRATPLEGGCFAAGDPPLTPLVERCTSDAALFAALGEISEGAAASSDAEGGKKEEGAFCSAFGAHLCLTTAEGANGAAAPPQKEKSSGGVPQLALGDVLARGNSLSLCFEPQPPQQRDGESPE